MAKININILIVDDQDDKAKSVKEFIASIEKNVSFEFAKSQLDALNVLERKKFDLVILDMCLPLRNGEALDELGGENVLDELDVNESYKRPSLIIALTQFDELQEEIRSKFPELGAIKYSNEQTDWQKGLQRVITASKRAKEVQRLIIYCEDKNDILYNLIGLENLEFRGLRGGSRKVYENAKFEKDNFAVRDKDYLTRNEVKWLRAKFPNYFILDYYCFENYLFHPDNMEEYFGIKAYYFDKNSYIEEIISQKNSKLLNIAQYLHTARNSYFDFTDNQKSNMDSDPEIIRCLQSDDFEVFYPYFDMKGTDKSKGFDRSSLSHSNVDKRGLATTRWFVEKMRKLFADILI